MKKIIVLIILFIGIAFSKQVNAQINSGVPDTLAYLQTIVANKVLYIGKPFSVLVDSLKIQIKFFSPFSGLSAHIDKETSTSFSFYFPQNADEIYLTYPCLDIIWQTPLNKPQSMLLYNQNPIGGWSAAVAAFYSTAIIAEIKVWE
jgi:hypothetical protein